MNFVDELEASHVSLSAVLRLMDFLLCPLLAMASAAGVITFLLHSRLGLRLAPDVPNARSLHRQPIPRLGGLGILLALGVTGYCVAGALQPLLWLAGLLALLSLLDDLHGLPVRVRLLAHLGTAAACVFAVLPAPTFAVGVLLILILTWGINLYNFMDGANGLAGGMALIGFASLGSAAWLGGDAQLALFAFTIAAAALGFLLFNFHPARIFLGDCGSIPLGFLAGALSLWGWRHAIWEWWLPVLVFSPFLTDATLTLLQRALRGEKFWHAHRDHYYQRLIRMGWSHRRLAITAYLLMLVMGGLALWLSTLSAVGKSVAGCGILGIYVIIFAGIDRRWRHQTRNPHPA